MTSQEIKREVQEMVSRGWDEELATELINEREAEQEFYNEITFYHRGY